jgi:hypothetical protein
MRASRAWSGWTKESALSGNSEPFSIFLSSTENYVFRRAERAKRAKAAAYRTNLARSTHQQRFASVLLVNFLPKFQKVQPRRSTDVTAPNRLSGRSFRVRFSHQFSQQRIVR